jgi:uncharacterized protein (DUF1810 family)
LVKGNDEGNTRRTSPIFHPGKADDLNFRSSMTLFAHSTTDNKVFLDALRKYFQGEEDRLTMERL